MTIFFFYLNKLFKEQGLFYSTILKMHDYLIHNYFFINTACSESLSCHNDTMKKFFKDFYNVIQVMKIFHISIIFCFYYFYKIPLSSTFNFSSLLEFLKTFTCGNGIAEENANFNDFDKRLMIFSLTCACFTMYCPHFIL